ncbi:MAG: hypothetical protein Q8M15_13865 [Bacteroidota bacterium]|nr:hypothetical protein [Bacteroidota bacterium]
MKCPLIIAFFVLSSFCVFNAKAQTYGPLRLKNQVLLSDTFTLDSNLIVKGSVKVYSDTLRYIEGINYKIDYYSLTFINLNIPIGTLLKISYIPVLYNFKQTYQNKDKRIIQPEFTDIKNPFVYNPSGTSIDPFVRNEGLLVNGSVMRGLSFGNNQNAVVNSNLNLQLAGKINNDVDILAAISDDNNPIQPEGNSQELQDFDQVYVQFSKNNNKLVVGDFLMVKPEPSYFLNYYKKSRGLQTTAAFNLNKKSRMQMGAQAALSRGRFVRNVINGVEGNQGPYRLSGPNGELFIIIISGTDAVYLDGERLTRGEQNDYVIDYNSGELTFMPRRIITQYSRIVVEFQYSDRNYARTLFGFSTSIDFKKSSVYLNYFTEQDNKNQPFQQNLSDSNKALLASVGNKLEDAVVSSAVARNTFDAKKILYRKVDTLGYPGVYVLAADANSDTVFYELRFSFTGLHRGNYKQSASGANGRVFVWVEPINGVPQGDFEPVIILIAPNKKQLFSVGTLFNPDSNNSFRVELAQSIFNRNLYSELDKQNDKGYGARFTINNKLPLGSKKIIWHNELQYEFVDQNFRYVERYRNVEFDRIWNRQLVNQNQADTGFKEHILSLKTGIQKANVGSVFYQLGYYNRAQGLFNGLRNVLNANLQNNKNQFSTSFEWMQTQQKPFVLSTGYINATQNLQSSYARKIWILQAGAKIAGEQSSYKNNNDTLLGGSFVYKQFGFFLRSADSLKTRFLVEYNQRQDEAPNGKTFQKATLSKELKGSMSLLQTNFNKLNIDIAYREFTINDTNFSKLKPEQTLLTRIEYDYAFFQRFISANTYIQLGSGNELRRDFQYLEVPIGQGIYVWKDFNADGHQQLNEFLPASFSDKNLANYIKVYLPTTSFIRTNSTQLSQTLNLNPLSKWGRAGGLKKLITRFNNQTAIRYERKVLASQGIDLIKLYTPKLADNSLITVGTVFRNTLFFNRNNPVYGLDLNINQQQSKNLLTNGFESRNREEYGLNLRWNLTANWSLLGTYNTGTKLYTSEYFTQNNYRYQFNEIKPKLSFQWLQKWRMGINYSYYTAQNLPELGNEKSHINEAGAELRYTFTKIGVLTFKYSYYEVGFTGSISSPLAYDMLQGLSAGNNQLWNISLQQRIGQNLQINVNYDGRKSGTVPVTHIGKMEARYLF